MKHTRFAKMAVALCAGVLMAAALGGCAQQGSAASQQQSANRQYMTQVNQVMEDLQGKLDSFSDAVSRGDVVGMRTQADNAVKSIDELGKLEVPDELKEIQQDYADGTGELKDALNAYVDLYTEIDSATDDQPFDWATYDQRVGDIQKQYDDGIAKLKDGDAKAVEKNE
ncbi:hypothetical protein [Arabiibacter massiliensis]|uniref:hypothetical protein n=1 Tax=Arabiibacter massiliensis TaxID=1870985 RepID=UPI0009BBF944|nr:hypothetical protein [Arabiibacter massiliensis]